MGRVSWYLSVAVLLAIQSSILRGSELQLGELQSGELQESPNVIVIMVDDLGNGDLSCTGAQDLQSPHIDALFKSGMSFDFAYANCPVCSPSRASLMTGRYPELVGVPGVIRTFRENSWGYLDPDSILLPRVIKTAGYHTALIGKWHLGLEAPNRPGDRGFDLFHGFLADMMDDYYQHQRHNIEYMYHNNQVIDVKGHATDLFTDWSCDYLNSRVGESSPFFLCLTYNAPHTPIQPPEDWYQMVKRREPAIDDKRAKLVALIEHMDAGIGRVMTTLRDTGLDRNTLVVFTSDNGGQLNVGANNGALRDGKQSMYEGGLRVPTCFVWPGKIEKNSKSSERMITMDLFPTVCEAAGVSVNFAIDGVSLLPLLKQETSTLSKRDLFFHRREGGLRYGGLIANAMIRGEWKLLQNSPFEAQELYNLSADPLETDDKKVANKNKYQEMAKELRLQVQRGGVVRWQKPIENKR